jgi:hypothetical protein
MEQFWRATVTFLRPHVLLAAAICCALCPAPSAAKLAPRWIIHWSLHRIRAERAPIWRWHFARYCGARRLLW